MAANDTHIPPDLLKSCCFHFQRYISRWCPILHPTTYRGLLPKITNEEDFVLAQAIIAVSLRFLPAEQLPEQPERYNAAARRTVISYALENTSISSLKALAILSIDLMGTSKKIPSSSVIALMMGMAEELGIMVESNLSSQSLDYAAKHKRPLPHIFAPASFVEEEGLRRLFWTLYLLDRFVVFATAFDFCLKDAKINRRLPCHNRFFLQNTTVIAPLFQPGTSILFQNGEYRNFGGFSFCIDGLSILSRIHIFLGQVINIETLSGVEKWFLEYHELERILERWRWWLPPTYGDLVQLLAMDWGGQTWICEAVMVHTTYLL